MINFRDRFVKFRRELIVEHDDVMLVLECISEIKHESRFFNTVMDMEIGDCGWSDDRSKWFIHLDLTNNQWENFINKLACEDRSIILKKKGKLYVV